jgi:hypothetical protein
MPLLHHSQFVIFYFKDDFGLTDMNRQECVGDLCSLVIDENWWDHENKSG